MFKRILIVLIVLFAIGGAIVLGNGYFNFWPELNSFFEATSPETEESPFPDEQAEVISKPEPIDGTALLERFEVAQQYESSPEEAAEDLAFESEQIEEAQQWLLNLDSEQRLAGIEQLAAYPSPKAEQLMVEALKNDKSEEIRSAAADNLSYIEIPTVATQDALIHALQDSGEDVRNSALNTLESYVASLEEDDATAKRIVSLLKQQMKSKQVPADIKDSIKDYLTDQIQN